jgi:hypothetical protein
LLCWPGLSCKPARKEVYGGTMTTWGLAEEAAVQQLLDMPPHWAVANIMPLGKPVKRLTGLRRRPVEEIFCAHTWSSGNEQEEQWVHYCHCH